MIAGRKIEALVAAFMAIGLLVACAPPAPAPTPTKPPPALTPGALTPAAPTPTKAPPAKEEPKYGGILKVLHRADPLSYDLQEEVSITVQAPLAACYSTLLQHDPTPGKNDKIIADLAEKWEISPDGKVYTLYFRKNVKWHDGKPFTSEDAKYSLDRMLEVPKGMKTSHMKVLLEPIDRVEAPDPYSVKIYLKQPDAPFLSTLAKGHGSIFPKHVVEAKGGNMRKDVLGTGAFKFKEHKVGVSIELEKNKDYFTPGRPYLDGIILYIVKDASTRLAVFRTGQADVTSVGSGALLTPTEASIVKKELPDASVYEYPALLSYHLYGPLWKPPFTDIRMRRALQLVVDRQAAIKAITEGHAQIGNTIMPSEWAIPEAELAKLPGYRQPKDQDIAEAKKLVAEAGFPGGLELEMMIRVPDLKPAEFFQHELTKIGIKGKMTVLDVSIWEDRLRGKQGDLIHVGQALHRQEPDDIRRYYHSVGIGGQNYAQLSDPKLDRLWDQQAVEIDPKERIRITRELDRYIYDQAYDIVLYWETGLRAARGWVRDWEPGIGSYNNGKWVHVWLAK